MNGDGVELVTGVRGYLLDVIPIVDFRFENLDFLPGNPGAAQAADQLVRFSAEHRTCDHFNGTGCVFHGFLEFIDYPKKNPGGKSDVKLIWLKECCRTSRM